MAVNMNHDYQADINAAVAKGDYAAAAAAEQQRNDKITSSGYTGSQTTTNNYSQYLNNGSTSSGGSSGGTSNAYSGTDYYGDALNAAYAGDADTAYAYLSQRADKMNDPAYTGTGGGTSMAEAYANIQAILAGNQKAPTLPSYQAQTGAVNNVYDAAQKNIMAQLNSSYEASKLQTQQAQEKIPAVYQAQANNTEAQYEKNKQAMNESAAASGVNTGAGSQANLAMNTAQQGDMNTIRAGEASAIADSEAQLTQLYSDYQNKIAEAVSNNEYERAAALLEEYQTAAQSVVDTAQNQANLDYNYYGTNLNYNTTKSQNDLSEKQSNAETLAAYGDFSGYKDLGYTDSQVSNMESAWIAANPEIAYNTGKITAAQYTSITGKTPAGVKVTTTTETPAKKESGGNGGNGGGSGYDNGSLTASQVKTLQTFYGVTADGLWGTASKSAAHGKTADEAWDLYKAYKANNYGATGNYQDVAKTVAGMKTAGKSTAEILAAIREAYQNGLLSTGDYSSLYNQYRG